MLNFLLNIDNEVFRIFFLSMLPITEQRFSIPYFILIDDILDQTENGNLPESITNGHTQALIEEKSLEESMEEYEESLDSDTTLSEDEKNKILSALSFTAENFNEEREDRRDRLRDASNQLSNDDLNPSVIGI